MSADTNLHRDWSIMCLKHGQRQEYQLLPPEPTIYGNLLIFMSRALVWSINLLFRCLFIIYCGVLNLLMKIFLLPNTKINRTSDLKKKEMDHLPPELWEKILSRLPVKTIGQFTCVCISWKKLIQAPSFIDAHLQFRRSDFTLVRTCLRDGYEKEAYNLYCDDEPFKLYAKLDFPFTHPWGGYYRIIGSCNGVLCIASGRYSMKDTYLWNPTIRKFVELPRPHVTYGSHKGFEHEIGFGYDVKKKDFKVVRIVETDKMRSPRIPLEVQIYSLNSGLWRNVSHLASAIKCRVSDWTPQAYLNEAAHWVAKIPTPVIVLFHFGQEVFRCFEVPSCTLPLNIWPLVVQGSLFLVGCCKDRYIIWIMNEYGDSSSWTVWFNIINCRDIERLFGFKKESELLLQIRGKLCIFNLKNPIREAWTDDIRMRGVLLRLLKDGYKFSDYSLFIQKINTYHHNSATEGLGFHGIVHHSYRRKKFWCCEGFLESLALIGMSTVTRLADHSQSEEDGMKSSTENIPGNTSVHLPASAST